jgi:hypothetical protein
MPLALLAFSWRMVPLGPAQAETEVDLALVLLLRPPIDVADQRRY